jgi:hypothetical protein
MVGLSGVRLEKSAFNAIRGRSMLVWRGAGILAAFVAAFGAIAAQIVFISISGDDHFVRNHWWAYFIVGLSAALAVWGFSRYLDRDKGRVVIDKASGKEILLKKKHDIFFIPVRFWPYIIVGFTVLLYFAQKQNPPH